MRIHDSILQVMGHTPLVRLQRLARGLKCRVVVKIEALNPGGSVKDRIGIRMIEDAERRGLLRPGGTIIESTSGNTGVGLAIAAALRGYRCIFTTNDKQSREKVDLLKAFGAEVIVCPTAVEPEDPRSYYSEAKRLAAEIPNSFYTDQYHNQANPETHYVATGPEIWEDTDGTITHFVAGLGTGGTISGVGKYLKERNPDIRMVGVDPVGSLYEEYFRTGKLGPAHVYKVEGIGEDFLPTTVDFSVVDEVVQVTDKESFLMARKLAREEGIFAGGSSGSALAGALKVARRLGPDDLMVVLLPDRGERNLGKVFNDAWMRENQYMGDGPDADAEKLLEAKPHKLETLVSVLPETSVHDAIHAMKENTVSQVPVIDEDGACVGSLREDQIIDILVHGRDLNDVSVGDVMEEPFPVVEASASALDIQRLLSGGNPAVLVSLGEGPLGILTKFDLVHALGR